MLRVHFCAFIAAMFDHRSIGFVFRLCIEMSVGACPGHSIGRFDAGQQVCERFRLELLRASFRLVVAPHRFLSIRSSHMMRWCSHMLVRFVATCRVRMCTW